MQPLPPFTCDDHAAVMASIKESGRRMIDAIREVDELICRSREMVAQSRQLIAQADAILQRKTRERRSCFNV